MNAWSAGTPDDPSTPRRLSLARALAVRAVLISEGVASPRIYVRALGADGGDPPDRAEITRAAAPAPAPGPGPPSSPGRPTSPGQSGPQPGPQAASGAKASPSPPSATSPSPAHGTPAASATPDARR